MFYVSSDAVLKYCFFFFSSRRRHTRCSRDWSSDVCSSDLPTHIKPQIPNSVDTLRVALPPNSTSPTSVGPERLAALVRQSGTLPYPLPTHRQPPAIHRRLG